MSNEEETVVLDETAKINTSEIIELLEEQKKEKKKPWYIKVLEFFKLKKKN